MGRYAAAESAYRRVLKLDPENVFCLNNLSVLLTMWKGDTVEALPLIERAIEIAGPQAALLDSRAMTYATAGEHAKALADLDRAIGQASAGVLHFHRAVVADALGNGTQARADLVRARELGFQPEQLHALESRGPGVSRLLNELKAIE